MPLNTFVENAWYVAGRSSEFPANQPKGLKITGRPVLLWRSADGNIASFDDRCVHKRMPLSEGVVLSDGVLECPYHGFCYDSSGKCVRIPSQLDLQIPTRAKLRPFPVVEQDGLVWVWPGDAAKIGDAVPPRTPELASPDWTSHMFDPLHVPANYVLLIENLMDITHFYPLHDGNIGDIEQSKIPIEIVEERLHGVDTVKTVRRVQGYKQPPFMAEWFGYPVVDRWHTHHMMGPGLTRVELRCAPPGKLGVEKEERGYIIHHSHTPIDGTNHTWRLWVTTRSKDLTTRIAATFPAVMDEDLWVLERQQRMFEYPEDGYHEVYLRSDKALLRCRKILEEMEQTNRAHASPVVVHRAA
ncbi:MAG: aromatic ring-hydroxylating dioxygenase subunit alpha [Steroidobacteraceae bacterium]